MRTAFLIAASLSSLTARAGAAPDDSDEPTPLYSKAVAAGVVGGIWATVSTWAYFAWFYGEERTVDSMITLEGFGADTYAGGADKVGHAWASYALTRLTTKALVYGGWPRFESSLVAGGVKLAFSTLSEVEDSYVYQFELGDVIANVAGTALAIAMENLPALDRWVDFRFEYFPSSDYRYQLKHMSDVDLAQDYTGQSYLLALHLGAPVISHEPAWLRWRQFVDVVVGFETNHYKPVPRDPMAQKEQVLYTGVAIDFQGVLRAIFRCDTVGRRAGETTFELLAVPYTTLRVLDAERSP